MAKVLSVKMGDDIFKTTEQVIKRIGIPRNAYINKAVQYLNRLYQSKLLKQELCKESLLIRGESLSVLKELEALEDADD